MKRMLFNATHPEETRVGIVDGQKLIDIDIETAGREARKSNIYKGVVTRIEPSLEACFVDYGEERHGFLPFKEISRSYFAEGVDVRMATIKEAIREGQELIVQVEKEERGNKGAALTTFISLAGRYLVLMPNNPRAGGVSRRIEGEERQELREAMDKLDIPSGMSTIARTAGIGRTTEELQWDLNYLLKLWNAIVDAARPQYEYVTEENGRKVRSVSSEPTKNGRSGKCLTPAPFLIVEESNLVVRAIRDYFQPEIGEILVDTDEIYEQARQFMANVMPDMVDRVKRYRDDIPLFTRFQIEQQIETAYSRTVPLPSGGAIVIDHTEALVAIDVNSARATRGADIEDTAFRTNCEAADEVARQMRLRDLGGLIVIDFIDMAESKNQRAVEQRLKDAIRYDRARVQTAKISRFGLMELSRQRLRPALSEGSHITCPRCNGVGVIRDTESCAIQVLRILQEEAMKEGTGAVQAQVPVDVATFLLNEKRNDITKLEARHRVPIVLVPNTYLETPHYHIERIRQDDERLDTHVPSFDLAEEIETTADDPYAQKSQEEKPQRPKQVPVIKNLIERDPAPVHAAEAQKEEKAQKPDAGKVKQLTPVTPQKSLFQRIIAFFTGGDSTEKKTEEKPQQKPAEKTDERRRTRGGRNDRRTRSGRTRTERTERLERAERSDRSEKTERSERPERSERTERAERTEKTEGRSRRTRTDRADRSERTERAERTPRTERTERSDRDDRRQERRTEESARPAEDIATMTAESLHDAVNQTEVEAPVFTVEQESGDEERRSRRRRSRRRPAEDEAQADRIPEAEETQEGAAAPQPALAEVISLDEGIVEGDKAAEQSEAREESDEEGARRRRPRRRRRSGRGAEAQEGAEAQPAQPAEPQGLAAEVAQQPVWTPAAEPLVQIETKSAVSQAVEGAFAGAQTEGSAHDGERRRSRRSRKPRTEAQADRIPEAKETKEGAAASSPVLAEVISLDEGIVEGEKAAERAEVREEEKPAAPQEKAVKAPEPEEKLIQIETRKAPEAAPEVPAPEAAPATTPEAPAEAAAPAVAAEAPAAPAAEPQTEHPALTDSIAEGLEENLRSAGLVQVHTAKPSAATGYEPVVQPGRVVEHAAAEAEEGPLTQVHTKPELCRPVDYAPVIQPGRKVESSVEASEAEVLVQVETKKN